MSGVRLRKLLRKDRPLHGVMANLLATAALPVAVQDADGTLLLGVSAPVDGRSVAIEVEGATLGWVCGAPAHTTVVAQLLGALLAQEAEKRTLASEMLDKYRELNLLYTLSERLLVEPDPAAIARLALAEAGRLIELTAGWVLLWDGMKTVALGATRTPGETGERLTLKSQPDGDDLLAHVLDTREAEIRNDVAARDYLEDSPFERCALICAPLKTEQRVLGAMLLLGAEPVSFAARDRKLLNTVALQVAPALEMARLYQVAVEKGRMERELQLAYQVQSGLIPVKTPQLPGWQFAGRWRPARELSGDYYDFIEQRDGRLGLVIGDVADKGMPSALFMVHTRAAVRTAVRYYPSPAEAIYEANRLVHAESNQGHFVTLLYACLDMSTGELRFVNAGHNPALIYDASEQRIVELQGGGLPLGIVANAPYEQGSVTLEPGDFLVMYTDGLTEAIDAQEEEFGVARLRHTMHELGRSRASENSASEIAATIERALDDFLGEELPFDDLTMLVVKAEMGQRQLV